MVNLLPASAAAGVQRAVKDWLEEHVPNITFEQLEPNDSGICVATIQSPAYSAKYITGGYAASYRFRIILRVLPSDDSDALDAVEFLTLIGAWCETATPPNLDNCVNEKITRTSDAAILASYEDGCNDYGIDFNLTWEVFI